MKLYLTSYRIPFPDELFALVGKKPEQIKIGCIPNAKDYFSVRARNYKINESLDYLKDLGLKPRVIDLIGQNKMSLVKDLAGLNLLWVMGGNTFCLRSEMQKSGFDQIISKHVEKGLVFAGESAGAVVAGNSLTGVELADNPNFSDQIVWEGLNLIDNYILPHADNIAFAEAIEDAREQHKNDKTIIELTDAQVLIVDGDERKILG